MIEPHWFRAGKRYEDYGYARAPLCRECGETFSHPLHRLPTTRPEGERR